MKREREIDIAKGIAILLVVIGHSYSSQDIVRQLINAFHMPFFFIASGILYRLQYIKSGRKTFNCSNKFKSLVVPWLIWGNCYQLFLCILKIIGGTSMSEAIAIFGGQLIRLGFGPMWFLPALFIASALFLATLQNTKLNLFVLTVCFLLGVFSPGNDTSVANTILRALLGCTFISIGFYGASLFYKIKFHPSYVILIAVAFTVVSLYNGTVAMYERLLGRYPFLYVATGVLGSWFLLQISKYIAILNKGYLIDLLELYGANSIIILCLHNFVIEIVRLVDYKFLSSYLNASGFIGGLIITCITMLILTPLFPFCEKYVQRFFGGKLYIKCWNKQSYIERNTK